MPITPIWDVIVVGAGPAGALAAYGLATRGVRVLLVEQRFYPRWKVCGACLSPQAIAVLEAAGMGELVAENGGRWLDSLELGVAGLVSPIAFGSAQVLSRACLDHALVQAAEAAGAGVLMGTRATLAPAPAIGEPKYREVVLKKGRSCQTLKAKVVLIAGGLAHRCLEDGVEIATRISTSSRVGAGCVLPGGLGGPPPGVLQMAVGRGGYVGLVQVEGGETNVACAFDPLFVRACGGASQACQTTLREAGFPQPPGLEDGAWQLTPALSRRSRPLAGHRFLVLGDAAGYVEPFTGEGMGWALTSSFVSLPLVLRGLEDWDGAIERDWGHLHQRWVTKRQSFCRAMASLLRNPAASWGLHRLATTFPSFSSSMIKLVQRPTLPCMTV